VACPTSCFQENFSEKQVEQQMSLTLQTLCRTAWNIYATNTDCRV